MAYKKKTNLELSEEAAAIRERYKNDRLAYFRECLKIRDRQGAGLVPLEPNHCQLALLNLIERTEAFFRRRAEYIGKTKKDQVNIVVLKPRKEGVSTLISALSFHMCEFEPNTNSLTMAHRKDGADNIATISRRFYQQMPKEYESFKVPIVKEGGTIEWGSVNDTNWDSRMVIASASNESVARGYDFNFLHISEEAFFRSPDALSATKIAGQHARYVFEESTANGKDSSFYPGWQEAMYLEDVEKYWDEHKATPPNWNGKIRFFWAWFQDPEYRLQISTETKKQIEDSLTPEEEFLISNYALDYEQLAWRRHTIRTKCSDQKMMTPEDFFRQEYPNDPETVFITSGNNVFSLPSIDQLRKIESKIKEHGHFIGSENISDVLISPSNKPVDMSDTVVYKHPEVNRNYIVVTDTKHQDEDFSVCHVFLRNGGKQIEEVAFYRGKCSANELANLAVYWAYKYNSAYMINNATSSGVMTCQRIAKLGYPHIYKRRNEEVIGESMTKDAYVPGIKFWRQNDTLVVEHLKEALILQRALIRSEWVLKELESFEQDGNKLQAAVGQTDDGVTTCALAMYANNVTAPPVDNVQQEKKKKPQTQTERIWAAVAEKKKQKPRKKKAYRFRLE